MNKTVFTSFTILCLLSTTFLMGFKISANANPDLSVHNIDTGLNYTTIQGAINAPETLDRHTIIVDAGTYYEHVTVHKSLTLQGENKTTTIIDGNGTSITIYVTADNVSITGFTVQNSLFGIQLRSYYHVVRNCTISDNKVNNTTYGIYLLRTRDNHLAGNTIANSEEGIRLYESGNNTLRDNKMIDNEYNFNIIPGGSLSNLINDIDTSNKVNNMSIYYLTNEHNLTIDQFTFPDAGYIALINSTNIAVRGFNLTHNGHGVYLAWTICSTVENVDVSCNRYGIYGYHTSNNTIVRNVATKNRDRGIYLHTTDSSTIRSNILENNGFQDFPWPSGLDLYHCRNCTISNNTAINNEYAGIKLAYGYGNNVFRDNNMTGNRYNFALDISSVGNISDLINDIDTSNTVDGKLVYYLVNQRDIVIDEPTFPNVGYIALVNSTNVTVNDLELTHNKQGILLAYTTSCTLNDTTLKSNEYGIYVFRSSKCTITGNIAEDNARRGIYLYYSNDSIVTSNTLIGNGDGVYLLRSKNNVINGNDMTTNENCISLSSSCNCSINGNNLLNNTKGIQLGYSSYNILRNNNMTENSCNFGVYGDALSDFIQDIDASNTVNNKPIYYLVNRHDEEIPSEAGFVAAINCTCITVKNSNLTNNQQGILFSYTTNSTIKNVYASNNRRGIELFRSKGIAVGENKVDNNECGILLSKSNDSIINGNMVYSTREHYDYGIYLSKSSGNTVSGNEIVDNNWGVALWESSGNTIKKNNVKRGWKSFDLYKSSHNFIYHNNLINNTIYTIYSVNKWDNGVEGNYWSDYDGIDLDDDGIGDTKIPWQGVDNYPLIHSYNSIRNLDTNLTYLTIQSAINAPETLDGHTILVEEGIYCENVVVDKSISLIGENKTTTIIEANFGAIIDVTANNVNITGFTIQHSSSPESTDFGIYVTELIGSNISYNIIRNNYRGIYLSASSNNSISGNNIMNNKWGIYLYESINNDIFGNDITANHYDGIRIIRSTKNNITKNNIINNDWIGISLADSSDNAVSWNFITNIEYDQDDCGVWLTRSSNNKIFGNDIVVNWDGIYLVESSNNTISGNNITNNDAGIDLYESSNNIFFHNNFRDNYYQVYVTMPEYANFWDNGYSSGGNYWSDYSSVDVYSGPYQNETGFDWIGDIPYIIDENNQDNYPLVSPYVPETEEARVAYRKLLEEHRELQADFDELNSSYSELARNYTDLGDEYESLNASYHELLDNYDDLVADFDDLNITYRSLSSNYTELQEHYDSLQSSYDKLQAAYSKLNATYSSMNLTCGNLQSDYESLSSSYHKLQESYSSLSSLYDNLNATYNDLKSKYEETVDGLNSNRNLILTLTGISIAGIIILIATTVYFAIRKPKTKP